MKKIKITICTGTTCYVLGNAQLLNIKEEFDADVLKMLEIKGSTCLKFCKDSSFGSAPFVEINGKLFAGATLPAVKNEIERLVEECQGGRQ